MDVVFDADSILWKLDIDVSDGRADDATVIRSKRPVRPTDRYDEGPFSCVLRSLAGQANHEEDGDGPHNHPIPRFYGQVEKIETIKASLPYV